MLGVLLAALSGLSYGASDFSGAVATKDDDAALVTVAMQIVSLLSLLALLVILQNGSWNGPDMAWGALGGLGAAIGLTTFYRALARGPMSTAAAITGLVGALVPIGAGLALGDRPSGLAMVGIGLSIPAVVLLSAVAGPVRRRSYLLPPRERTLAQAHANQTRVLAAIAGLGFGLFFVALSRTSGDSGLVPLVGARLASIAALALVISAQGNWTSVAVSSRKLVVVAGVLDCAANSFYLTALNHGTFTWIAAISSLYPVATVLLARIFLRERLAAVQVAGLACAGLALVCIAVGQ